MKSALASTSASLFEVYLRLRPSQNVDGERFIDVEEPVVSDAVAGLGDGDGDDGDDDDDGDDGNGGGSHDDGNKVGDDDDQVIGEEGEEGVKERKQQQQKQQQEQEQQEQQEQEQRRLPTPTHITIKPPSYDHRKRAVERFAFTRVFEEDASQRDVFTRAGVVPLIAGVLGGGGADGAEGAGQKKKGARDGLLATLGMTGSGKVCYFGLVLSLMS